MVLIILGSLELSESFLRNLEMRKSIERSKPSYARRKISWCNSSREIIRPAWLAKTTNKSNSAQVNKMSCC